jgi:mRNA interferase HigB
MPDIRLAVQPIALLVLGRHPREPERRPLAAKPLDVWFHLMRRMRYTKPAEVKADFPTASFLGDTKTVFNIGGNKYRLVVNMRYDLGKVFIRHVLTHKEYDKMTADGTL